MEQRSCGMRIAVTEREAICFNAKREIGSAEHGASRLTRSVQKTMSTEIEVQRSFFFSGEQVDTMQFWRSVVKCDCLSC